MSTPVLGVQGGTYPAAGSWSVSFGWRYQESDKHFVGSEYQEERTEEGSEVINHLNLADLSIRYQATKRVELSFGAPYLMATRSQTIRNTQREIIERYVVATFGRFERAPTRMQLAGAHEKVGMGVGGRISLSVEVRQAALRPMHYLVAPTGRHVRVTHAQTSARRALEVPGLLGSPQGFRIRVTRRLHGAGAIER